MLRDALTRSAFVVGRDLRLTKLNSSLNKMSFLQTHASQGCRYLPAPDLDRMAPWIEAIGGYFACENGDFLS